MKRRCVGWQQQLDFDDWSKLARQDRPTFERLRRMATEQFIADAPEARRERLRCLQWRIDQERRRSSTPLGACIRISRMMWDQVMGGGGLVEQLRNLREGRPSSRVRCAQILPLMPEGD